MRDIGLHVRVTIAERQKLEHVAQAGGVNLSEVLRALIRGAVAIEPARPAAAVYHDQVLPSAPIVVQA